MRSGSHRIRRYEGKRICACRYVCVCACVYRYLCVSVSAYECISATKVSRAGAFVSSNLILFHMLTLILNRTPCCHLHALAYIFLYNIILSPPPSMPTDFAPPPTGTGNLDHHCHHRHLFIAPRPQYRRDMRKIDGPRWFSFELTRMPLHFWEGGAENKSKDDPGRAHVRVAPVPAPHSSISLRVAERSPRG